MPRQDSEPRSDPGGADSAERSEAAPDRARSPGDGRATDALPAATGASAGSDTAGRGAARDSAAGDAVDATGPGTPGATDPDTLQPATGASPGSDTAAGRSARDDSDAVDPTAPDIPGEADAPGALRLGPPERDLRSRLLHAFTALLDHALAARERHPDDPARAIYEFRKALRRCRALLRLVNPALPGAAAAELRTLLAISHRATSALRDTEVLTALTARAATLGERAPDAVAQLRESLAADAADQRRDATAATILDECADRLAHAPRLLAEALPADVSWKPLRAGLAATYRLARQHRKSAMARGGLHRFHAWRRRHKELTYQLELLLSELPGAKASRRHARMVRIARELGQMNDLATLGEYALGRIAFRDQRQAVRLSRTLGQMTSKRARRAVQRSERLYRHPARRFAGKIIPGT